MSGKGDDGIGAAIDPQSQQEKAKAPRRVENMKRINREGLAGPGGRRISHGQYALDQRLRDGLDPDSAMAHHHAEKRAAYAATLGGMERLDEFQIDLLDRLADNSVNRGVLLGLRAKWRTSTVAKILRDIDAFNKNGLQYLQLLKAIKETDQRKAEPQELIIRKFAADPPKPVEYRENEQ